MRAFAWVFLGCLAGAPGCGGKVVFADDGAGGATTSTGPSGTGPSSTTTTTSTSSGMGPGEPTCSNKCSAQAAVGCSTPPGCDASCQSVFANANQGCNAALAKYYACFAANPSADCQAETACSQEQIDYFNCVDAKCAMGSLSAPGDGSCTGVGQCGAHMVSSTCLAGACTCTVDGVTVGTCSDGTLTSECGFDETCCTSFFPG